MWELSHRRDFAVIKHVLSHFSSVTCDQAGQHVHSLVLPAHTQCHELSDVEEACVYGSIHEALVVFTNGLHIVRLMQHNIDLQEVAELPEVFKPAGLSKFLKCPVVSREHIASQANVD